MEREHKRDFMAGFQRAGLALPTERLDLMVQAYAGYRALAARLDMPMGYDDEPAGLYRPADDHNADGARQDD